MPRSASGSRGVSPIASPAASPPASPSQYRKPGAAAASAPLPVEKSAAAEKSAAEQKSAAAEKSAGGPLSHQQPPFTPVLALSPARTLAAAVLRRFAGDYASAAKQLHGALTTIGGARFPVLVRFLSLSLARAFPPRVDALWFAV